jgi:hypothetical protein
MARFELPDGRRNGDGLDSSDSPAWLLVQVGVPKQVRLRDAAGWTLNAPRHGLVSVTDDGALQSPDRRVTVTAYGPDMTTIAARSPDGRHAVHLAVYTRPLLRCNIAFYFMRDSGGHATRRVEAEAGQVLQRLNAIYQSQANIVFDQVDLQSITVPRDLGSQIDLPRQRPGAGVGPEFAAIEDATEAMRVMGLRALSAAMHARVRVHFVWRVSRRGSADDTEGTARLGGTALLVEDRVAADLGTIVAHEVGHLLGLDHPGARRGWLMFPTTQGIGTTIPKRHVDVLNPAP